MPLSIDGHRRRYSLWSWITSPTLLVIKPLLDLGFNPTKQSTGGVQFDRFGKIALLCPTPDCFAAHATKLGAQRLAQQQALGRINGQCIVGHWAVLLGGRNQQTPAA